MLLTSSLVVFLVFCVLCVKTQDTGVAPKPIFVVISNGSIDLSESIKEIFKAPDETPQPPENTTKFSLQPIQNSNNSVVNPNCTCVAYYLCRPNGTIITNGETLLDIRDKGECGSYMEKCCSLNAITTTPITTTTTASPNVDSRTTYECGYRNLNGLGMRITGDEDNESQFAEFPWMVAVLESVEGLSRYRCGGAIIHPQAIITAAHCIKKNAVYKIRAGEWDSKTTLEPIAHQDRDVSKIRTHEKYYAGAAYNDIAFLYLEKPLIFTGNVQSICLEKFTKIPNESECYVTGWGKENFSKNGTYQSILKKIKLPIVQHEDCVEKLRRTRLGKYFELHQSFICAGGEKGVDACYGDGGGPLVCLIKGQKERYYQAGIVSWGIGCGEEDVPGAYANVPLFRYWIDDRMKEFGLSTESYLF